LKNAIHKCPTSPYFLMSTKFSSYYTVYTVRIPE
jgi:hypothetical protein